jgi:hypothetical protein
MVASETTAFCKGVLCFPTIAQEEESKQLDDKARLIKRMDLAEFRPIDERSFEDWVDSEAPKVTRNQVGVQLFQEAWVLAAPKAIASQIGRICTPVTHEELVDKVAMQLFRSSRYVLTLEREVFDGQRQRSVLEAECWLRDKLFRYFTVCQRRGFEPSISDSRTREILLSSLPMEVEAEVRRQRMGKTLEYILEVSYEVEAEVNRRNESKYQPLGAMVADHAMEGEQIPQEGRVKRHMATKYIRGKCFGCAQLGHYYRLCPHRNDRCANCQQIGHISAACRNTAIKDDRGRVNTLVKQTPGRTEVRQRRDRTTTERVQTAQVVLDLIKQMAARRAETDKERRKKKRSEKGEKPKRRVVEHPVRIMEEVSSKEEDENPKDEDQIEKLLDELQVWPVKVDNEKGIIPVQLEVNQHEVRALADSGAAKSICSQEMAEKWQLELTEEKQVFSGLGRHTGIAAKPVKAKVAGKEVQINFYVLPIAVPTLLGNPELAKLKVLIDPQRRCLLDCETYDVVGVAWDDEVRIYEKEERVLDTFGETISKEDKEVLQQFKKDVFPQLLPKDVNPAIQDQVWGSLIRYRACWIRPRIGGVKTQVQFEVIGAPVVSRLRHLTQEMKEEFSSILRRCLQRELFESLKVNGHHLQSL